MLRQKEKTIINCIVALLLVLVCLLALPTPGFAHVMGSTSWSAPLPVVEKEEPVGQLLTSEGQHVLLSYLENSREIEIPFFVPEDTCWYVTVTKDTDALWVTPMTTAEYASVTVAGLEGVTLYKGGAQSMTLQMQNLFVPATEGNEAASVPSNAAVEVVVTYVALPEEAEEMLSADLTENSEPEETPVVLGMISAVFHVPMQAQSVELTGTLAECPAQYHPDAGIPLVNGAADSELKLLNEVFPAMTRCKIDGVQYLLYDDGTIPVPADAVIALDVSRLMQLREAEALAEASEEEVLELTEPTEESGEPATQEVSPVEEAEETEPVYQPLTLLVGGYEHTLTYADVPALEESDGPIIMSGSAMVLPLAYRWEGLTPVATVERMRSSGGSIVWEQTDESNWLIAEAGTGLIVSTATAAEAGTYRLTLTWSKYDMTLYSVETVFYVRSGFIG